MEWRAETFKEQAVLISYESQSGLVGPRLVERMEWFSNCCPFLFSLSFFQHILIMCFVYACFLLGVEVGSVN